MVKDELLILIDQPEGPTIEFKREFYKIFDADGNVKKHQKDEMIKDVLALVNGSLATAGETAYLIFGVEDQLEKGNSRKVIGIQEHMPVEDDLLKMMRFVCEPPLSNLKMEKVDVGAHKVYVLTIHPSPYLHETTRKLETPSQTYSPYVIFIRRNSCVDIATQKERKAIEQLKTFRISERKNVPPILYGALVGALVLTPITGNTAERSKKGTKWIGWIVGLFAGAFIGASFGYSYKTLIEMISDIKSISIRSRNK